MGLTTALWLVLRAAVASRAALVAENLALQHQLLVLQRSTKRPKLCPLDRLLWVCLSKWWPNWRSTLKIFQPDTVVKWHQQGFTLYWRWLSKPRKGGRPRIDPDIQDLIRRMAHDNPGWGAPRILSELLLLGYTVSQATVAKYMPKTRKPPSQTWRTFLTNHVSDIAAIDFFTVPTLTFGVLYGFLVLRHAQRQVVHFNVTAHPTAKWTAYVVTDEVFSNHWLKSRLFNSIEGNSRNYIPNDLGHFRNRVGAKVIELTLTGLVDFLRDFGLITGEVLAPEG